MATASRLSRQAGRWDNRLICHMQHLSYDFLTRTGRLDFPDSDCCDLEGAVNLFTVIDSDVRVIETFAGGVPDTLYRREHGVWKAFLR